MKRSHKIRAHTQSYTLVVHHMMSYYTNSKLYSNVSPLTTRLQGSIHITLLNEYNKCRETFQNKHHYVTKQMPIKSDKHRYSIDHIDLDKLILASVVHTHTHFI